MELSSGVVGSREGVRTGVGRCSLEVLLRRINYIITDS
jgi:hypothetical protein